MSMVEIKNLGPNNLIVRAPAKGYEYFTMKPGETTTITSDKAYPIAITKEAR